MADEPGFRILTADDWTKPAASESIAVVDGALALAEGAKEGFFLSRWLDSGRAGCAWHRVVLEAKIPENMSVSLEFRASDDRTSPDRSWAKGEKPRSVDFRGGPAWEAVPPDALIPSCRGRYLAVRIALRREVDSGSPGIVRLTAWHSPISWLKHLPAIYSEGFADPASFDRHREFLERFLSLFESLAHDCERNIVAVPSFFDPMAAPDGFVPWLAGWLALDRFEFRWLKREAKDRKIILRAWNLYRGKGTAAALASLVTFLTGRKCFVKEYANNVLRSFGMEHCDAEETVRADGSKTFYHKVSTTVDTRTPGLSGLIDSYDDPVHYVPDWSGRTFHSPRDVVVFIPIGAGEGLDLDRERVDEIERMLVSFLPVRMRARIVAVQGFGETMSLGGVRDFWTDDVRASAAEVFRTAEGTYEDGAGWKRLVADDTEGRTNDLGYRSAHAELGTKRSL